MQLPLKPDLRGKTAVITGGGGILCACMAKALSACGARVAVCSLRAHTSQAVVDEIRASGGTAIAVAFNVLEKAEVQAACTRIEQDLGPIDILINGAGGNHPKGTTSKEYLDPADLAAPAGSTTTFFDLDPAGIAQVFNLNFQGTLLPSQVFCRGMADRKQGVVINITSMNSFRPLTKIPAYSGAKAAVSNFTQWMAVHFSQVGIRVNALAPGFFLTNQNRALLTDAKGGLTARGEKIIAHTPLRRFGDPEDLIGALLWLVSDASKFVTGVVVPVDGGFSAYSGV
ncbi:MAG: SDR family oxidoreductase [Lentisphaerae bacterium]|nr:SDR family oxidoreductase [Lentisphaerota bacterium]